MANGDDKGYRPREVIGFVAMFACAVFMIWLTWLGTMKYAEHWHDGQHVEDVAQ